MREGTVTATIIDFQESYNGCQQDDRRLDEEVALLLYPGFVQVQHGYIGRFIGVGDIAEELRVDRVAAVAAARIVEVQYVEFRGNFITVQVGPQVVEGDDAQVRKLEVVDIHGEALLDLLFDEVVDHGIGLAGARCAEDRCRPEGVDDIDPPVMHPALIPEPCGQVDRIFIGQQPRFLHERFILIVEHVLHHVVFQQAADPHPGGHEEHISGPERRDIEDRYDCRDGAQV